MEVNRARAPDEREDTYKNIAEGFVTKVQKSRQSYSHACDHRYEGRVVRDLREPVQGRFP